VTQIELRQAAEYLWAGEVRAVAVLGQLKAFKRFPEIVRWLVINQIRGKKLIEFFNDAEGTENRGVLMGVKKIYNYIDSDKFNKDSLRAGDLVK
jgi:hypothetical protein